MHIQYAFSVSPTHAHTLKRLRTHSQHSYTLTPRHCAHTFTLPWLQALSHALTLIHTFTHQHTPSQTCTHTHTYTHLFLHTFPQTHKQEGGAESDSNHLGRCSFIERGTSKHLFGWSLLSFLHGLPLHPESWVLVKCELGGQFAISSQSSQLSSISRACVASRVRGTHFSRGLSPLSSKAPMVHQCRLRFQPTWLGPARRGAMEGLSRRFQANGGVRPSPPEFTRNTEETKWTSHFSLLKIYKDSWTRAETSVTSLSQSSLYFSNDSCDQRQEVQHLLRWLPHRTFQNPGQSDQGDGVS